jgi:tetratricopeptide (TPR) repeat protein
MFRAIELSTVHGGRNDEALAMALRLAKVDPLSAYSYLAEAVVHFTARRFEAALVPLAQAEATHPNMWITLRLAGLAKSALGDLAGAVADLMRALEVSGRHPWIVMNLATVHDSHGNVEEGRRWAEIGLAMQESRYVQPSVVALCLSVLNRFDDAFAWLERACVERDLLPVLNHFGVRDNKLARDPRWPALMRRIGLEPARLPA